MADPSAVMGQSVCVLVFMFLCVPVYERALGRVMSVCIWCVHVSLAVCCRTRLNSFLLFLGG